MSFSGIHRSRILLDDDLMAGTQLHVKNHSGTTQTGSGTEHAHLLDLDAVPAEPLAPRRVSVDVVDTVDQLNLKHSWEGVGLSVSGWRG